MNEQRNQYTATVTVEENRSLFYHALDRIITTVWMFTIPSCVAFAVKAAFSNPIDAAAGSTWYWYALLIYLISCIAYDGIQLLHGGK